MTNEELCLMVERGCYPIAYRGDAPHCSNCGCSESMHNREPNSWPGHKGCDNHTPEAHCWGGFDLAPGGTYRGMCTHRNGCKEWCTYWDKVVAYDAEDEGKHELAAEIRKAAEERANNAHSRTIT